MIKNYLCSEKDCDSEAVLEGPAKSEEHIDGVVKMRGWTYKGNDKWCCPVCRSDTPIEELFGQLAEAAKAGIRDNREAAIAEVKKQFLEVCDNITTVGEVLRDAKIQGFGEAGKTVWAKLEKDLAE